jgi:formamidopyrimidine-DNA glycosylase
MPELPDIAAYITALELRVIGLPLERVRLASPFLLRTTSPALSEAEGRTVRELRRVGKRIAIGLEGDLWLVLHRIRQTNYRVDRSGGWRYCRAAAQAAGVSPASR